MRTEQKLILAVGVLAGGFALSLPFRREVPTASPTGSMQPNFSRDLNLTLRRETGTADSNRLQVGKPMVLPHVRITAVPDDERDPAQKKNPIAAAPSPRPIAESPKTDALNVVADTTKVEAAKVEAHSDSALPSTALPPSPSQPSGRIRDLKPL